MMSSSEIGSQLRKNVNVAGSINISVASKLQGRPESMYKRPHVPMGCNEAWHGAAKPVSMIVRLAIKVLRVLI